MACCVCYYSNNLMGSSPKSSFGLIGRCVAANHIFSWAQVPHRRLVWLYAVLLLFKYSHGLSSHIVVWFDSMLCLLLLLKLFMGWVSHYFAASSIACFWPQVFPLDLQLWFRSIEVESTSHSTLLILATTNKFVKPLSLYVLPLIDLWFCLCTLTLRVFHVFPPPCGLI